MKQARLNLIGGWGCFAYYEHASRWMVSYLTMKPVARYPKYGQPTRYFSAVKQVEVQLSSTTVFALGCKTSGVKV